MATFGSGSFTTSTPFHQQNDSGFCDSSPRSRSSSQSSIEKNLRINYLSLRKNLYGERKNSNNIPINQFSLRRKESKLLHSRSFTFSRRDDSSNVETPRTTRIYVASDKPVYQGLAKAKAHWQFKKWLLYRKQYEKFCGNDSGCNVETPIRSESPNSEDYSTPLLEVIKNSNPENSKEKGLEYFKHALEVSGTKNLADLPMSDILQLYNMYRFQRIGLKPSILARDVCETHTLIMDMDEGSEMLISSWKDRLERISADLKIPSKIDFLGQLHNINAYPLISKILSYLSDHNLQNASCVSQLWRKLVLEDEEANRARLLYLKKMQVSKKEAEIRKWINTFQRPPNFRILSSIENIQKEQLQLKKTIKEINFDAFIQIGKSDKNHRPMKCPSCCNLSVQNKHIITKYNCLFCGHEFCNNCLRPYSNWHTCALPYMPKKPPANDKRYLRRL